MHRGGRKRNGRNVESYVGDGVSVRVSQGPILKRGKLSKASHRFRLGSSVQPLTCGTRSKTMFSQLLLSRGIYFTSEKYQLTHTKLLRFNFLTGIDANMCEECQKSSRTGVLRSSHSHFCHAPRERFFLHSSATAAILMNFCRQVGWSPSQWGHSWFRFRTPVLELFRHTSCTVSTLVLFPLLHRFPSSCSPL